MPVRLRDVVAALGGELIGDPATEIARIAALDAATPGSISFLSSPRYRAGLAASKAACVIVAEELRDEAVARGAAIVTPDPYLYYARLSQWWAARLRPPPRPGIHPAAVVEEGAVVDPSATVGALAFVGTGARVGAGAVVGPQAHVGADATVGDGSRLGPHAVLAHGCRIGARVILHGGAVIGADGFGFAADDGQWQKIEQLGAVCIGDDVEIGANTCIDRGAIDDTVVEDGVKIDNLVQIGHNVRIGAHTAMAGCVGVAGSTTIGRHCMIGGAAIIIGHLRIADHVVVSAATVVSRSILRPGHYSGFFPFDDNASWEKNAATLRHLHSLRDRVRALEKKP